jgi:hypothetical protein
MSHASLVLDDFSQDGHTAARWTVFTDRVMGGVSLAVASIDLVLGRRALRLQGRVSLEKNGGFVQMARPLGTDATPLDASSASGLTLDVCGMPGTYFVHLRTEHTRSPRQHYRAPLPVAREWATVHVPWSAFEPISLVEPLETRALVRLGVVGGTAAFNADVAVARLVVE